jgi:hypothetical protein
MNIQSVTFVAIPQPTKRVASSGTKRAGGMAHRDRELANSIIQMVSQLMGTSWQ